MKLRFNGEEVTFADRLCLDALVVRMNCETQHCAIAVNNRVIPQSQWNLTSLSDGDVVSVFNAIAGG
ncbi:sulfur carrier protein ThiS [Vibrio ulleungensis]|uniref:Sulfur carrier protein ThiS n=1 Tax=Vibrio ulleungensis TaxID=2807619 RepID=A0ABS2HNJ3_9VIBR|nr:sulfur carrier protein ThiS [Vibrio ulleungensis]MBM7038619.1 sulfur carrier protein ThiS [Vibrio ulleungensis]